MVDRICQGSDVAALDRKQQAVEVATGWVAGWAADFPWFLVLENNV